MLLRKTPIRTIKIKMMILTITMTATIPPLIPVTITEKVLSSEPSQLLN